MVALKVRVPEKLFVLVRVIEVVPDEPGAMVSDDGLGLKEKSGFVTVTPIVAV